MIKQEKGFTLLELLVALAILGLIGVALARTTGMTVEVWKRSSAQEAKLEQIILRNKLREWIERAKPADRRTGLRQRAVGDGGSFRFLTTKFLPINKTDTETEVAIIVLADAINVEITVYDQDRTPIHQETRNLIQGVDGTIKYFDRTERDSKWFTTWRNAEKLPDLIAIEATPERARDWPPFAVAPLLN